MTEAMTTERTTSYPTITPEGIAAVRALIGVPLRRRVYQSLASREMLLRYAKAIGCRNPLHKDPSHGLLNTAWAAVIGHPTALYCFDNTFIAPKLAGIHAIYAGVTFEWAYPLRAGDTIKAEAKLTAVEEKEGVFCGPMVLQTGEVVYTNQYGRVVGRAVPRVLRTPRDAARGRGKYAAITRHQYKAEEIDAVMRAYRDEEVRGERPRYWEEVTVGDALPPIVKGPLTTEDMNFFIGEMCGTLCFREFLAHWRRHPADVFRDPETGMPDSWDSSLLRDATAREFGFPAAHDSGMQRVAWLDCLITNWMSDLAFLRRLDVRLMRPVIHGDTNWCRGEVTEKRWEQGRPLVDLSVRCVNQNGEITAAGTATVELLSHDVHVDPPCLIQPEV